MAGCGQPGVQIVDDGDGPPQDVGQLLEISPDVFHLRHASIATAWATVIRRASMTYGAQCWQNSPSIGVQFEHGSGCGHFTGQGISAGILPYASTSVQYVGFCDWLTYSPLPGPLG